MKKNLFIVVILCLVLVAVPVVEAEDHGQFFDSSHDVGKLTARFLKLARHNNEKGGDSTILISPEGKVMLIDSGNSGAFTHIDHVLTVLGISKIDYLVASHSHTDHIGSFTQLIDAYEIGQVYTSELEYPESYSNSYTRAMDAVKAKQIPHIVLVDGDSFTFGEEVLVEVLHPTAGIEYYEEYPLHSTAFINNLSLVLKITFGESSFLFGGDLYRGAEVELVERHGDKLDVDVLKVNHHGEDTSSYSDFRQAVSARIAVIMHDAIPDQSVYQKFIREGTDTYVTSIDGNVLVSTAGDGEYTVVLQH